MGNIKVGLAGELYFSGSLGGGRLSGANKCKVAGRWGQDVSPDQLTHRLFAWHFVSSPSHPNDS